MVLALEDHDVLERSAPAAVDAHTVGPIGSVLVGIGHG